MSGVLTFTLRSAPQPAGTTHPGDSQSVSDGDTNAARQVICLADERVFHNARRKRAGTPPPPVTITPATEVARRRIGPVEVALKGSGLLGPQSPRGSTISTRHLDLEVTEMIEQLEDGPIDFALMIRVHTSIRAQSDQRNGDGTIAACPAPIIKLAETFLLDLDWPECLLNENDIHRQQVILAIYDFVVRFDLKMHPLLCFPVTNMGMLFELGQDTLELVVRNAWSFLHDDTKQNEVFENDRNQTLTERELDDLLDFADYFRHLMGAVEELSNEKNLSPSLKDLLRRAKERSTTRRLLRVEQRIKLALQGHN